MRSKKLFWISGIALAAVIIISGGIFLRSIYRIPVLMYHSVDYNADKANKIVVSPEAFERQMKFLRDNRYNVIPLSKAVEYIKEKKLPPDRTVVITMDDGYEDNYKYVYPVLKKYAIPATIFVIVDKIGDEGFLTWSQIKEMSDSGIVDIESHTMTHQFLQYDISDRDLEQELAKSREAISKNTGKSVEYLCYPMGGYNERAKRAAEKAGYKGAVATKPTKAAPDDDIYEIKRVRISSSSDNLFVFWIKTSGYHSFFRVLQDDKRQPPQVICKKKEY